MLSGTYQIRMGNIEKIIELRSKGQSTDSRISCLWNTDKSNFTGAFETLKNRISMLV